MTRQPPSHTQKAMVTLASSSNSSQHIKTVLLPATAEDIETIAALTVSACRSDRLSVPFQWSTTQDQHLAVRRFLSSAVDDSAWETIKAVHPSTGQILAWGSGKIFPADWDSASVKKEAKKETEKVCVDEIEKAENKDGGGVETEFSTFLGKEEQRLRKLWFSGRRWFYLCALFTDPEWQGRGIGTAVIEKLCERVDKEGVVGFLQGTKGATGFYESRGWKCIERFEVDLGKWVAVGGWGYGIYVVGYLVRLPKEKQDVFRD